MKTFLKRGSLLTLVLTMALAFGLLACVTTPPEEPFVPGSGTFTLLHTNDMHGRLLTGTSDGMGLDRVSALANRFRAEGRTVLMLDAGDALHGQPTTTLSRGEAMVSVLNAIGYDAFVPGNHDFNYGYQRLVELSGLAHFPFLAANITVDASGETLLPPYLIQEIGGLTIAIFGLATPETVTMSHPDNSRGLTFANPVETARAMVAELRGKADVVIALSHLGYGAAFDSRELARQVEGIDIIVDGHSHTSLPTGEVVGSTLIVSANEYNKNLGVVEVVVENGEITSINASYITKAQGLEIAPDQAITDLIAQLNAAQAPLLAEKVGSAAVVLDGERANVRTRETAFGDFIADAYRTLAGAEIALQNGGGIRTSVQPGDITMGHVMAVFPFSNRLVTIEFTGTQILAALEHSVRLFPEQNGGFLHVSGLRFTFDPSRPAGSRINPARVLVGGQPLDLNRKYLVATIDFLAVGGDGYAMFTGVPYQRDMGDLTAILAAFIRANSPVNPVMDNRIVTGTY
ncbi:MAG: multifunctional 2',3'-cyclic-nucleotide 2'-phosphodiesterase/5'-nucleotidase/3'-nucleotidase [Spirochaetes bacterium GWB1_60_80]|nr:MAG: multifunctional 2',3'-cyclic-nucleotide 2'-phosphodiesterase/5'-nucleotidase/3'-nucleotidase [Spirochaetes bacterium GWB1_60_80]OHD61519.1 MAG: multifunctional 2',3'-cyclic-nucleotide 2'-phosphodiesterase/5'-nucleotidase/3'-nucleotidase [Spirochaetes bacterium GWF1_60_12]HAP43247.1 multifunctional 2',3'-cyclic-nucleotide 2'-phosphodiesterase/5'-nucleotidase/3'-nucleotidase [Spirochaetaceae bacterium]HAX36473.1 multifunctional 2',3'-cyclic-nucleotide 2'-phosphodiesterase/5'-nucleotidase/3